MPKFKFSQTELLLLFVGPMIFTSTIAFYFAIYALFGVEGVMRLLTIAIA